MSALSFYRLLVFCYFHIFSLFHSTYSTAVADVWGLAARDAEKLLASPAAIYYFTPHTVLPWPMFGVGSPRRKKASCISGGLHLCSRFYPILQTTTHYQVLPRTTCLHLGQPIPNIGGHQVLLHFGQPTQTSATVPKSCLHLGQPTLHVAKRFCMSAE